MSTEDSKPVRDIASMTQIRPAEIKTYHKTTYDRISPSKTFDGKGKTVLITGGAVGIGLSIANSFAQAGVSHLILIQRRQTVLDTAKKTLESSHPGLKISTHAASVTDFEHISSILNSHPETDILVSNVAISHPFVPSAQVSTADFRATFDTNVVATFHIVKEFLALPPSSSGPRVVVNVSSAAAQLSRPGNIGYGPSKAAINQVMQHFAAEAAAATTGIDVTVTVQNFHPGIIRTEMAAKLEADNPSTYDWEDVRLPGDFAVWLASPEAAFLAGKFVWAQWDVDELLRLRDRLAANPALLTTTVVL